MKRNFDGPRRRLSSASGPQTSPRRHAQGGRNDRRDLQGRPRHPRSGDRLRLAELAIINSISRASWTTSPAPPSSRPLSPTAGPSRPTATSTRSSSTQGEIHQRPQGHGRRREIFDRARGQSQDAGPGRRLLSFDRRPGQNGRRTASTISGIEAVDDTTVKFTLSQPDATFLNVLALNFASAVPKEAVEARARISARSRSARAASSSTNGCPASASCSRATKTISATAQPRRVHGRDRPGAAGRDPPAAEGRGRHRRRRHSARQISRDEGVGRRQGHDRRARPARDELRHDQRRPRSRSTTSRSARRSTWRSTRTGSCASSTAARRRRTRCCRR